LIVGKRESIDLTTKTMPKQLSREHNLNNQREKIEILSIDLLDQNRTTVEALKRLSRSLSLELGWHYLLDLTWILQNLGPVVNRRMMDAGAGVGVLQWYLAQQGAEVISVDRASRAELALRFRSRSRAQGLRKTDLIPVHHMLLKDFSREASGPFYRRWVMRGMIIARDLLWLMHRPHRTGQVWIYNQDLASMSDIPENSLDAVVSVSALEHNTAQGLKRVIEEIMRVIKPGGVLLATLAAARDQDWFHEPSSGWCYTEASLRQLFDLSDAPPSNYSRYDELLKALRNCAELRDNLARFYSHSDKNGMPWGKWDPSYQPVGICKQKQVTGWKGKKI